MQRGRGARKTQSDFALYRGFGRAGLCRGRNPRDFALYRAWRVSFCVCAAAPRQLCRNPARVSLGRAVPAPTGEAIKARDRRATPAAKARRFIQRTNVQRPGAAAARRLDSPPARPSQAWAWRFFLLEGSESSHGPCSKSRSWSCLAHSFYYLMFSILAMRLPSRLARGMRKYDFVDPGKQKFFLAKPGLSELRAVSAQKRTF